MLAFWEAGGKPRTLGMPNEDSDNMQNFTHTILVVSGTQQGPYPEPLN